MAIRKIFRVFVLAYLALYMSWGVSAQAKTLNIGLLVSSGGVRQALVSEIATFENLHPTIVISNTEMEMEYFKSNIERWMREDPAPFDIVFSFAGRRLRGMVENDLVEPLDDFWLKEKLDTSFSKAALSSVSVDGMAYGIPFSYYPWGLIYRKSVFEDRGLTLPDGKAGLGEYCTQARSKNIIPFAVGAKNGWPLAGWFDYLNLRLNGYAFHMELMSGNETFEQQRVYDLFTLWSELLAKGCFEQDAALEQNWREPLALLTRKKAGMYLMGSFLIPAMPEWVQEDMTMKQFPILDSSIPRAENAPTDILIIPKHSKNKAEAKMLLAHFAQASTQERINAAINMLSPNIHARTAETHVAQHGKAQLSTASHLAQFFDRDSNPAFVPAALEALKQFFIHQNPEMAVADLEAARLSIQSIR